MSNTKFYLTRRLTFSETNLSMSDGKEYLNSVVTSKIDKYSQKYPQVTRAVAAFMQDPFSGDALQVIHRGDEIEKKERNEVKALQQPVLWNKNAPIVMSQYGGYDSDELTQFWNTVLPDVKSQYGDRIRFEHHDTPNVSQSSDAYKLATIGRCVQDLGGVEAFWLWFNTIMVDGIYNIEGAYDIIESIDIDVDVGNVREAVEYDLYGQVIWNDIYSFIEKSDERDTDAIETQLEEGEPVFGVFINGNPVSPTYDSIVGEIERINEE